MLFSEEPGDVGLDGLGPALIARAARVETVGKDLRRDRAVRLGQHRGEVQEEDMLVVRQARGQRVDGADLVAGGRHEGASPGEDAQQQDARGGCLGAQFLDQQPRAQGHLVGGEAVGEVVDADQEHDDTGLDLVVDAMGDSPAQTLDPVAADAVVGGGVGGELFRQQFPRPAGRDRVAEEDQRRRLLQGGGREALVLAHIALLQPAARVAVGCDLRDRGREDVHGRRRGGAFRPALEHEVEREEAAGGRARTRHDVDGVAAGEPAQVVLEERRPALARHRPGEEFPVVDQDLEYDAVGVAAMAVREVAVAEPDLAGRLVGDREAGDPVARHPLRILRRGQPRQVDPGFLAVDLARGIGAAEELRDRIIGHRHVVSRLPDRTAGIPEELPAGRANLARPRGLAIDRDHLLGLRRKRGARDNQEQGNEVAFHAAGLPLRRLLSGVCGLRPGHRNRRRN